MSRSARSPIRSGRWPGQSCARLGNRGVATANLAQKWHAAGGPLMTIVARVIEIAADLRVVVARLAGFEPATRCLEGTAGQSPVNAKCSLTSSFAFFAKAGCGLR